MKFSERAFFSPAFSTSSNILDTVDCPNSSVTRTRSRPLRLMQPLTTSPPGATSRGRDSPVRAEVSSADAPASTTPSSGTRSPGLTTMTSPTWTVSGSASTTSPPRSTLATSGRISISAAMERRERPTA